MEPHPRLGHLNFRARQARKRLAQRRAEAVSRRTLGSLGLSTEDVMNKTVPMRVHACVLGTVPISFRLSK